MHRRAVVMMVGLMGCSGTDTVGPPPTKTSNPPPRVSPGEITQPDVHQAGELNARSANLGRLFAAADGSCYVRLPSDEPGPPGSLGETHAVPCTDEMKHPSFVDCGFGVITRSDAGDCVCEPWAGNPPPASQAIDCPDGTETAAPKDAAPEDAAPEDAVP